MMVRIFLFMALIFCSVSVQAADLKAFDYAAFSQIPVQHNGRVKPLDSFARINLQTLSGKQSLPDMAAISWLAQMLLDPESANARAVFYISHPDIISLFQLEKRKNHLYSFNEIYEPILLHAQIIKATYERPEKQRSAAQIQMVALSEKVLYYLDISRSFSMILPDFTPLSEKLAKFLDVEVGMSLTYLQMTSKKGALEAAIKPLLKTGSDWLDNMPPEDVEFIVFGYRIKEIEQEHAAYLLRVVPPQWNVEIGSEEDGLWHGPWELFQSGQGSPNTVEFLGLWSDIASAYRAADAHKFAALSQTLRTRALSMAGAGVDESLVALEKRYNDWNLFKASIGVYVASFLLLLGGGLIWRKILFRASFALLFLAISMHIGGVLMRMMIMGRPPVTNLYESILFVGLVCVAFGIAMEWKRKDGLGLLIGSALGAILQFLGVRYAVEGDSMGMLQAVLDTNFWLATHVVTITIGYGACFVGGLIAHIYLYRRIINPQDKKLRAALFANMRGVGLVALFFAALGTILGGIWADQSWGRFWGWDPKENGALLICLWLIWIMHGRIAGLLKDDSFAIGMVITNVIVALAWFGVNLLGVGLHSYGFTNGAAFNLTLFCGSQLLVAGMAYALIIRRT